jgi:hypothetical protein
LRIPPELPILSAEGPIAEGCLEPTKSLAQQVSSLLPHLDPGIAHAVGVLMKAGIETFESCQGGPGHAYAEPTVRFHGQRAEGFRALTAALENGLKVTDLRRVWPVIDGEPTGPWWELVFAPTTNQPGN